MFAVPPKKKNTLRVCLCVSLSSSSSSFDGFVCPSEDQRKVKSDDERQTLNSRSAIQTENWKGKKKKQLES